MSMKNKFQCLLIAVYEFLKSLERLLVLYVWFSSFVSNNKNGS